MSASVWPTERDLDIENIDALGERREQLEVLPGDN